MFFFKSALHVSGDKLAHLQGALFDCIYSVWYTPVSSNIGALYQKLYIQSKIAPEDGRVYRPKHVELIFKKRSINIDKRN